MILHQREAIQTDRGRFSCWECEKIPQPPGTAPRHLPRFRRAELLTVILFKSFGQHQPLNRQCDRFAREGVDLSLSTPADLVGAHATVLRPLHAINRGTCPGRRALAWRRHDSADPGEGKTDTGCAWLYVRDDRHFIGVDAPAALFLAWRNRSGDHPDWLLKRLDRHPTASPSRRSAALMCCSTANARSTI
ncbi:IS66 family transposase [Bosea vestrisii]|uniref:IS66 family transposase n=1 Tax=Bosea vestrisii TaxID=151416 RepID=UPI003D769E8B